MFFSTSTCGSCTALSHSCLYLLINVWPLRDNSKYNTAETLMLLQNISLSLVTPQIHCKVVINPYPVDTSHNGVETLGIDSLMGPLQDMVNPQLSILQDID